VIRLHDNGRPHIAITMKQTLMELLLHLAYSLDPAPSNYHLSRSMQHAFEDTYFHNYGEVE
ncbi:hypothetical protein EAI_14401, partial [Harpegnathos saltator]